MFSAARAAALGAVVLGVGSAAFWAARAAYGTGTADEHFPNVTLTTQDGRRVRFYDDLIKGKIVVINFIYSQCEFSCPLETARLAQVEKLLGARVGKDIFLYSITIDPDHDTPAVLREYAAKFHAGGGWTFLTGKKHDIDLLADRLGLSEDESITEARGADTDGHTPHLLIGNESTGQWLRDAATDNPRFLAHLIGDFIDTRGSSTFPGHGGTGHSFDIQSPGQYLFAKECAACHTVGHGDSIGPDLAGVTARRDPDWLARYIAEPDKVLASGDLTATQLLARYGVRMPNLRVGDQDLAALLDFLRAKADQKSTGSSASTHGDFALVAAPGKGRVLAGAETRFTVTFNSIDGFAGTVSPQTLGLEGARGAIGSWSVPSLQLSAAGRIRATYTILTLLDTPPGDYPIVLQAVSENGMRRAVPVTLSVSGPPQGVITAAFHPGSAGADVANGVITGKATIGGWVKDISTFPDGSVHHFSSRSNGVGAYTIGPLVLKEPGTYRDILIDTETGGRTTIVYRGMVAAGGAREHAPPAQR